MQVGFSISGSVGNLGSGARGEGMEVLPLGGRLGQEKKNLMAGKGKGCSKGWERGTHPGGLWEKWE